MSVSGWASNAKYLSLLGLRKPLQYHLEMFLEGCRYDGQALLRTWAAPLTAEKFRRNSTLDLRQTCNVT